MPSYRLGGVDIRFPLEAYDCQLVYMENVIAALQKGQNALLESPTGTGKTLSLLCATLAWRESIAQADHPQGKSRSKPYDSSSQQDPPKSSLPTVIYASRTHSQLQQVIRELKATSYRPKMVVLGSREQMCIHKDVQKLHGRAQNHACRSLRKTRSCTHHNRVEDYVKCHPELGHEPIDIEDLVTIGKSQGPCPYFVSRELHSSADIIFLPYNYLIDKENRKSLTGVQWENSVLIFDEAHNLEGICADAASFDLSAAHLSACIAEASQCIELASMQRSSNNAIDKSVDPENYAVLKALLQELESRINAIPIGSDEMGFTRPGSYIYEFLAELKITWETVPMLIDTLDYAVDLLQDGSGAGRPSKATACRLDIFRNALGIIFRSRDASYASCYRVHVQIPQRRSNEKRYGKGENKDGRTFSWWCFNPGLAMQEFSTLGVRSVILTSGTLSPLQSFAAELKLKFDVTLENPHVIGANQIWVGAVCLGPSGRPLNSSYRTRDSLEYKMELGNAIVNFARIVPDGLLVFFPSYYLLSSCLDAWQSSGQASSSTVWERICKHKQPVIEPKESALFNQAHEDFLEKLKDSTTSGAVFFAVCRGKVSEGLDFADRTGRAVILTGIPFAMKTDPKVRLKREYLDAQGRTSGGGNKALSGEAWYVQQAGRAVNQAVGRVIRHKHDYGAIILCDERFAQGGTQLQLSLWLRPHLKYYSRFGDASFSLTRFFKDKKGCCLSSPSVQDISGQQTKPVSETTLFLDAFSSEAIAFPSFTGPQDKSEGHGIFGRKTTELLSNTFQIPEQQTPQQAPLSVLLAAKRQSQTLANAAITPANRALGGLPGVNDAKRLKSAGVRSFLEIGPGSSKVKSSDAASFSEMKRTSTATLLAEAKARISATEYVTFLDSLRGLKRGAMSVDDVFKTMSKLFSAPERRDLFQRFMSSMPLLQTKYEEHLNTLH